MGTTTKPKKAKICWEGKARAGDCLEGEGGSKSGKHEVAVLKGAKERRERLF